MITVLFLFVVEVVQRLLRQQNTSKDKNGVE